MVLREVAELGFFGPFHFAVIRCQVIREDAQQRRFAHAIGSDDRDFLARFDHQIKI